MAKGLTPWEELNSWITSRNKFFSMARYERPVVWHERSWRLDIDGLVAKPLTFTLAELKSLPRREVICTIECSGSNGLPFVTSPLSAMPDGSVHRYLRRSFVRRIRRIYP